MNRLLLIVILLFQCISLIGQEKEQQNLSTGVLTLNHSYTISNRYQLKSSIEQRLPFVFSQLPFFTDKIKARTDVTTGLQRKLNTSFSTAVGGMFRFIDGTTEQRLYQQLGYVQQTLTRFKVAHRLRIDQTFSSDPFENRIRYRVGAELPRRGFRTDPGEQYVAVLSEFLAKSQGGAFTPELRVASQFGFLFQNSNKGELQIEVRINDVGRKVQENLFLLGLSYYFTK